MRICRIILPFGQMGAHFLLDLVFNGRGKPPQYIIMAFRAPIKLQKCRPISANIVLLYFMLPELLGRLDVKKRPLLVKSELPRLAGELPSLAEPRLYLKDKVEFALFPLLQNMRILSNLFISYRSKILADFLTDKISIEFLPLEKATWDLSSYLNPSSPNKVCQFPLSVFEMKNQSCSS